MATDPTRDDDPLEDEDPEDGQEDEPVVTGGVVGGEQDPADL